MMYYRERAADDFERDTEIEENGAGADSFAFTLIWRKVSSFKSIALYCDENVVSAVGRMLVCITELDANQKSKNNNNNSHQKKKGNNRNPDSWGPCGHDC